MKFGAIQFLALLLWGTAAARGAEPPAVDFQREVRPLLAQHCFACHGPDGEARQADLRLDQRDAAIEAGALAPGMPEKSELLARVASSDADLRMPPADHGEPLSEEQTELLRRWVAEGANYAEHWAFVAPVTPPMPSVQRGDWCQTGVDRFVLARLESAGRSPSPRADRETLLRRVYLDLVGVSPTLDEARAFLEDERPLAYERLVDQLLASPKYGERWARPWLDLARYADTNGYEKDRARSIWPYRDWVIDALNADMPYDQFSLEQLAGDMLPDATLDQQIATGFHRNTMINEEGGIDPLEFRYYAMVDRVATTGIVWMGLTTGCAQCHSHKYDPISHTDYYQLMALLNNADEPDLLVLDDELLAKRREVLQAIESLEATLPWQFPVKDIQRPTYAQRMQAFEDAYANWVGEQSKRAVAWSVIRPVQWTTNLPRLETLPDGSIFSTGDITKRDEFVLDFQLPGLSGREVTGIRLEVLPDNHLPAGGPGRAYYEGRKGDFFLSEFRSQWLNEAGEVDAAIAFSEPSHSFGKLSIGSGNAAAANVLDGNGSTGWSTSGQEGRANQLVLPLESPVAADGRTLRVKLLFERHFAASLGRFRLSLATREAGAASQTPKASALPVDVEQVLAADSVKWDAADRRLVRRHFLRTTPALAEARKRIDALRAQLPKPPSTMVMRERPQDNPRPTFRHHRGEYLQPKEQVAPGIPAFLRDSSSTPQNRQELAQWLVSPSNPLAARVAVNRAWREFWGAGLVRTSGDFGTQADPPTHPELLDYLATEFVANDWSLKWLHRELVLSAAYQQRSTANDELYAQDPGNRWLARGPRFRMSAEMVRDSVLRTSGLLTTAVGGPSVYPPQPASVTALAYGNTNWPVSSGADRYRRSLYTFSKRTAPFAAYAVFDAPTGETCAARRDRSNTPLQALTLLNDPMFLEAAQALGRQARHWAQESTGVEAPAVEQTMERLFRQVLIREPSERELQALVAYHQKQRRRFEAGELQANDISDDARSAAWTMTARVLLNLDETITKP